MLEKVKLYLRIENEYTEEDELISGFIAEAKEYCKNAVGFEPPEDSEVYKRFILLYAANAYEQRSIADGSKASAFGLQQLLQQLRHCGYDTQSGT